ncbi:MAG: regulatory iron-sulfur-containing complex subunit RicT [Bacteroidaceae bacterium]|nr:regulatory iron-sulfur-containing complex subunit RicT [Bacteroidaceae bacterium]
MECKYRSGGTGNGLCGKGCHIGHYAQLNVYDYLADIPGNNDTTDLVEVQFKNTRKGYYHNINNLPLEKGDVVAVESNPGHDIGTVTLTGKLVPLQMKKANLKSNEEIRRIYRKARPADMEKYQESKALEHDTMIRSRQIAKDLGLEMKIGDVEYQGDGNKAIFYYIADGRVDFRQLIKVLAEAFHVRIEMKQIGARQEAGRIGGFGPCGRELCCATWMKNFVSVGTGSARYQDLSRNPQKLAGQCAKLKCCMNYEVDQYVEAYRKLPPRDIQLQSMEGDYFFFKCDILLGMVTYSTDKRMAANLVTVSAQRAMDIIEMNKRGEKPETLEEGGHKQPERAIDLATQEDLNRFDKKKKKKKKNNGGNGKPQREETETAAVEQDKNTQNERPREQRHQQAHNANANNSGGGEQNRRRPSRPHAPRSRENNNHKAPRKDRE